MSVLDDVNQHRTELKTDAYATTVSDLLATYSRGDLQVNPEYQRLFRWNLERQSEYIESLLLNIPTPPVFFATNPDGKNEVIDGLQRLSTLIKFFAAEVFSNEEIPTATAANNEEQQNNIKVSTLLQGGPLVESLEGYSLATLPDTLTRILRYTRIPVILLEKESSKRARFHVFKRLNRSGSVLSEQEIRNCSARLFSNEFPEALRRIAQEPSVRKALSSLPEEEVRRMGIEEHLLRLLANVYSTHPLKHSVIDFLDGFMEFAAEGKFSLTAEIEERIGRSFVYIANAFPDGEAFRFRRQGKPSGQFSSNLYDIVTRGVYENLELLERSPDVIKTMIEDLHAGDALQELTGAGTNTRKKYVARLELGKAWFKPAQT